MNKTKIEWCDYTWNPITGCLHGCKYCYAERISKRFNRSFNPTFHPDRLKQPQKIKQPSKIFTVSMGDLFGDWVPNEWVERVLDTVKNCPQHTFIFLTKNPWNYEKFTFAPNCWVGTTITSSIDQIRAYQLGRVKGAGARFISVEPLLGEISWKTGQLPVVLDWVIVGAQTGPGALRPNKKWVVKLLNETNKENIPVFIKDNLNWSETLQEYPKSTEGATC